MSFNSSTVSSKAAGPRFGFASFFPRRWSSRERKSEALADGSARNEESSGAVGTGAEEAVGGNDAGIKFSMVHQTIGSTPAGSGGNIAAASEGAMAEPEETPAHGVCGAALDACGKPGHEETPDDDGPPGADCCANHGAEAADRDQPDICAPTPKKTGVDDTAGGNTTGHKATSTAKGGKFVVAETNGRIVARAAEGRTGGATNVGTEIPSTAPIA